MRRKLISLAVCFAMVLSFANFSITASADANFLGSGTQADPFLISTPEDLVTLASLTNDGSTAATYVNKYYQLTNDINMRGVTNYVPICYSYDHYKTVSNAGATSKLRFHGTLDGNGHIIKNVTIDFTDSSTFTDQAKSGMTAGIIGCIGHNPDDANAGGTVKNLGVENITITRNDNSYPAIGGIAGTMMNRSTVTNCYVKNMTVNGSSTKPPYCGGIVGALFADTKATITNCYTRTFSFSISDTTSTGGIFGRGIDASNSGRTVTNCYTTAYSKIGGSVYDTITITNSYSTSQMTGMTVTTLCTALGSAYKEDINLKQYGWPLLSWESEAVVTEEYTEGTDVLASYTDGWEFTGDAQRLFYIIEYPEGSGNHMLRIRGKDGNTGEQHIGKYKISLPQRATGGKYYITYDCEVLSTDSNGNYHTETSASLDVTGYSIYGAGRLQTGTENEIEVSGTDNYLYFAAEGWASARVDNIEVRDKNGNVLFTEDFEDFDEKYTYYTYNTRLQGLTANGVGNNIYLAWKNPNRTDIERIAIYENGEETQESKLASISTLSGQVNIVPMSRNLGSTGTRHTYDVRMYTDKGYFYHNYVSASSRERFADNEKTSDGIALQGWKLLGADATDKALGNVCYDTLNKAEGNASLHINPNITKKSSEQAESNKTSVMVNYGNDDVHAHFYLDAYVYGIEEGEDYKLTFKLKSHHAPTYFVYANGFQIGDGTSTSIGAFTGQSGYSNYTAWQERELEFTVLSVSSSGMPTLRFDFNNGCDDFWLDDVKLVNVDDKNETNLIANGNFECGVSNLTRSGNNVTWTLADSNDSINVYETAGDSFVKVATLAKGATSYQIPAFEGTKQTLAFRTVKKSGNVEFLSIPYTIDLTQDSYIYDAKFELVDSDYEAIGVPGVLTGNNLLKTSIKVENITNSLKGADLYTLIYKGGKLLNVDKQTVSTNTGEVKCSTVMSVPDISDGDYSAKVFVWKMGNFEPLKQAKTLDE